MSGIHNGLATLLKKEAPAAIFVHCHAHRLNLALKDSSDEVSVRNVLGTIN